MSDFTGMIEAKFKNPGAESKVAFFRLLAITQNAGLGIRDSLRVIMLGEKSKQMVKVQTGMLEMINEGMPLSQAMGNYTYVFNTQELALIEAAEAMGNLPDVLLGIALELERFQKLQGKIKSAMTYPSVIMVFAMIAVVILLVKVMPTITSLFPEGMPLPGITIFMLEVSDFIKTKWYIPLTIIVGTVVTYSYLYGFVLPFKMLVDKIALRIPIIGKLIKTMNLYMFAKMMADFSEAGISITKAVENIGDVLSNHWYKVRMKHIAADLAVGLSMVDSIEGSDLFPAVLIQVIDVGEKTGNLGEVLNKMADYYKDTVETTIETLMKLIEPLLMAVIAVIIGVIVSSVFLPMAELVNVIQ